jgi:hypothetical protein
MSGIYLIVWDDAHKDKSPILRTTKGGYPHITVAYTGKEASRDQLVRTAQNVLSGRALSKVTLSRAKVNSFEDRPGHMRHDVLLMLSEKDKSDIEEMRRYQLQFYPNREKFHTGEPHVTYGIYESEADALDAVELLNKIYLPMEVVVTGVTID